MNKKDVNIINHDFDREKYTNVPESILAEPKTSDQLVISAESALKRNKQVLITRLNKSHIPPLREWATELRIPLIFDNYDRTAIVGEFTKQEGLQNKCAVVSAGTSDDYLVEEIGFCLNYYDIGYKNYSDIGVAGIHRHKDALQEIQKIKSIKCIIVVAGQDGALFPVISAQTMLPVIAVPTSIGYGFGGKGQTALQTALQSCSPGVVVVNIDNGFGAASFVKKLVSLFH